MKWDNGIGQTERGAWRIRYRVPLGPNTRATKQVIETLRGCKDRKQARQVLALRMSQVFDGTYRPRAVDRPETFAECFEAFLNTKAGKPIHRDYKSMFKNHLGPALGKRRVRELVAEDFDRYLADRVDGGAALKTVKNEIDAASTCFEWAHSRGKVDRNPTSAVEIGKIDNRRERLLAPEELTRLLVALSETRGWLRPYFVVLYYTGLRTSDALALSWERINFEQNWLAMKQRKTNQWVYPPMHRTLRAELARWKKEALPSRWVFPSVGGMKHLTRWAVTDPWADLLKRADVSDLWRHDIRKLLVTSLKARGATNEQVQGVSGHATAAMVDRYNLGPDMAQLEESRGAIDLLPDLPLGISHGSQPSANVKDLSRKKPNNSDKT